MRNNSTSRTRAAWASLVWRMTSRLTRVWRVSTSGMAPAFRVARINWMANSSGTSIMSSRMRSFFFNSMEYLTNKLANFAYLGSVIMLWR
jgi:hypothetical protein